MFKLKKGDTVSVKIGKDKGRTGKIERVFPKTEQVLVGGVNISKRHLKKRDDKNPGGIVDIAKPLAVGKVALICPSCHKPTRVGWLVSQKDKYRICRKCGQKI